MADNSLGYACT